MDPKTLFVKFYNEAMEKIAAGANPPETPALQPSTTATEMAGSTIRANPPPKIKPQVDWMKKLTEQAQTRPWEQKPGTK